MSDRRSDNLRIVRAWWRASLEMCLLLAATFLVSSGCSRPVQPEVYAVEGILLVDGSPAANASVAFHPLEPGLNPRYPVARTDRDGRFQLTTNTDSDGAPPGDYAVTIVWIDETIPFDECDCPDPLIHDRLKGYYADPELTELRATVRRSSNSFQFYARRPPGDDSPLGSHVVSPSSTPNSL